MPANALTLSGSLRNFRQAVFPVARIVGLVLIGSTGIALADSVPANVEFEMHNRSRHTMVSLHITSSDNPKWEEDILDGTARPGEIVDIDVDDRLPGCDYDILATFDDMDTVAVADVDICELSTKDIVLVVYDDDSPSPGSAPGVPENVEFEMYNRSSHSMVSLHITSNDNPSWEENILDGIAKPGETVDIDVDDELPGCDYDLLATFSDNDTVAVADIDICELAENNEVLTIVDDDSLSSGSAPGVPANVEFEMHNDSVHTMTALQITSNDNPSWEEDILDGTAEAGESLHIDVDDELPGCGYDILATYDDGDSVAILDVDICRLSVSNTTLVIVDAEDEGADVEVDDEDESSNMVGDADEDEPDDDDDDEVDDDDGT
jgi:hypothetical protein